MIRKFFSRPSKAQIIVTFFLWSYAKWMTIAIMFITPMPDPLRPLGLSVEDYRLFKEEMFGRQGRWVVPFNLRE